MRTPILLLLLSPLAAAQAQDPPTVSNWAQVLDEGEWAFSIDSLETSKEGLRDGRDDLNDAQLSASGYRVYTDRLNDQRYTMVLSHGLAGGTLHASLPVAQIEREGRDFLGTSFSSETDGIGDLTLGYTQVWRQTETDTLVWSVGLGLPTGKVDLPDEPYPMQPAGGTFEFVPGAAWIRKEGQISWGLALHGRLYLDRNDEDWARSRSLVADTWLAYEVRPCLSTRIGLRNSSWGDVHGGDPAAFSDPLFDDDRQGGTRTDLMLGVDWASLEDEVRFGIEAGFPLDEWLDGPQPSTDMTLGLVLRLGW